MSTGASITTKEELVSFVNRVGECTVYPFPGYPDIFSQLAGENEDERKRRAWGWSDQLHFEKRFFVSLAIARKLTATSWHRFMKVYPARVQSTINVDEDGLLEVISKMGGGSSRKILQMSGMPAPRFESALVGLRSKMIIACCGVEKLEDNRYVYCYDLTDRWVPEEFAV
ncbi:MAG: hypothetical protein ABFD14_02975 [Anaerolineaceae bacterium]